MKILKKVSFLLNRARYFINNNFINYIEYTASLQQFFFYS